MGPVVLWVPSREPSSGPESTGEYGPELTLRPQKSQTDRPGAEPSQGRSISRNSAFPRFRARLAEPSPQRPRLATSTQVGPFAPLVLHFASYIPAHVPPPLQVR